MVERSYSFYDASSGDAGWEFPVAILSTGHERRSSREYRWDNERHHRSRCHILQYSLSGAGWLDYKSGGTLARERIGPGRLLIASWDTEFAYYYDGGEPWEFQWITLAGDFADRAVALLRVPAPVLNLPRGSPAAAIIGDLQERLAEGAALDRYALTSLGYGFLTQLLKARASATASPEECFLAEARALVVRDLRAASVRGLAGRFGYGGKYFIEYFREKAGTTPNRFIIGLRIDYASSLLVRTCKSVAQISEEVGFSDANYFSKAFRKETGLSPSEYRRLRRDRAPADELVCL